jgi:hypothetical protein
MRTLKFKNKVLVLTAIFSFTYSNSKAQEEIEHLFNEPLQSLSYSNKRNIRLGKLVEKQKLDSVVEKEIKYPANLFKNTYKTSFTYDSAGNNKMLNSLRWIDSTEQWLYERQYTNFFDKKNNQTSEEIYVWDQLDEELKPLYFNQYKYNSKNQKISYIYNYADDFTEYQYLKYGNGSYTYNETGNLICEYDTTVDPLFVTLPTYLQKTEYTYDNSQRELTKINASYDVSLKKYNFSFKKENIYDNNGNILKTTNFLKGNGDVFTWEPNNYHENIYNKKNQKIQSIYWEYNQDKRKILPDTKTEYFYDPNGNIITELIYYFYIDKWFLGTKNNYTYNTNFVLNDIIDIYDNNYPVFHTNMLTEINTEFWADSIWKQYQKKLFYYSPKTVNEEIQESVNINIYPNPTSDYLKIEVGEALKNIFVFDLIGRQIGTYNLNDNNDKITLDLTTYTNGYYFIQINLFNGKIITKQILKNSN